ncbi:hypothetical protein V8C86DRAFT_1737636 [Haematococcus lacustris]
MWRLVLFFLTLLGLVATSSGLVNCTASVCLAPGETWAPTALNVSGRLTVVGTPDAPASTLDFNSLTATFTPGTSIHLQDLTLVTVLAAPRTSSAATFLTPASLVGPGAPSITYTNVTLQLPSNCSLLGQYTSLLCQDVVNSSLVINRWGVLFHSWSSAAVTARNLNLTCGRSLPPSFNMLCSSTSVSQPRELLAALVDTATMAASTTSFIHVLANISLQGYVPDSAAGCGVAGRLVNITNKVVIAGVPTPENPRPELDWAGWCGLASVGAPFTSLQLSNLTQANLPVGPVLQAPLSFFTAATFIVDFVRVALGFRGTRLLLQDVTLLLPADEMVWWSAMAADPSLAAAWCSPLHIFEVANVSNASILVQQLRPGRVTYEWQNTLLVSVEQQQPSSTLLVHDTGVLRLNGLGAAVFPVQSILRSGSTVGMNDLRPSPFEAPSSRRVLAMDQTTKADISTIMALQRDTVITGNPYRPQALLLDLAAAPTRLGLTLPGGQLTLSNLVLGNAAPLLSSLVCGAAAQQQGVACNPASLNSTADPDASSRAVWRATRLGALGAEPPLTPLCSPALADALGGLTSLLWFFHSPRASPLAGQPSLASAPLVLLNVTILLPDLEAQAIREVAAGGSTRVNLRPDTLELLRAQLAGQQVRPASWPPGGLVFPTFSWFGVQGLDVTLAPATATDPWGEVWKNSFNILFPQIVPSSLTTMTHQPDFRAQRQQVLMEAELNAGLAHPNLVATYAYRFAPLTHSNEVATDWVLLLVCELCSCGSLSNAIVNGRLWDSQLQQPRVPQVLTVLSDVAHGMAYLHSRNIMHRDLKPDNVLLQDSPEGVVAKVADLGLGAVLRWQQTHLSNAYAGTPLYMAPEVQQQERSSLAGDVYSFGVLAWELLHGCTVWARLQQITQEPRYLQCLVPHPNLFDHDWQPQPAGPAAAPQVEVVLRGLRELVDACLQPQPGARPSFPGLIQQLSVLSGLHGGEVQGV